MSAWIERVGQLRALLKNRWVRYFLFAAGTVVLFGLLMPVRLWTDKAFIEETTGSRKGYREWRFGIRSGEWYQLSALETFIRTNRAASYAPRWTSYAGTEYNVFGMKMAHGHGRPGAIMSFSPQMLNEYCAEATDAEKLRLYDSFVSKERAKANELIEQMWEKRLKAE